MYIKMMIPPLTKHIIGNALLGPPNCPISLIYIDFFTPDDFNLSPREFSEFTIMDNTYVIIINQPTN